MTEIIASGEVSPAVESPYHRNPDQHYGLHKGVLSPLETLAQSVSAVAPSASPTLTIPLVFALAGNGTWFVYLLTTIAILLVGFCVSRFAQLSASPGSLYTYTADTLWPSLGAVAAWSLLLAYVVTGASVAAGALYYANVLLNQFFSITVPPVLCLTMIVLLSGIIALRDIKLSAEMMLWTEVTSVGLISTVLLLMLVRYGFRFDVDQLQLRGVHVNSLGPALVLAMFSFVGFESATTLGTEARNPLKTIPRAVIQCAILAGVFFILCAYAEVLGFKGETTRLSDSASPLHLLASKAGVSPLGTAIDLGAFVSMFACVLACTTASARVLLRMAHSGLMPDLFGQTHPRFGTPSAGVILTSTVHLLDDHRHGRKRRRGKRHIRLAWINLGLRLPHGLCLDRDRTADGAQSIRAQLDLDHRHQLVHRPGHGRRRRRQPLSHTPGTSTLVPIHLSWIPCGRYDLVPVQKKNHLSSHGTSSHSRLTAHRPGITSPPRLPCSSPPRSSLLLPLRLHHHQQHYTQHNKHPERRFLPVPRMRLPHQKPLGTHR